MERGETILLVDDDALSREVLAAVLASEGYEVLTAASGEEAVACLAARVAPADAVSGPHISAVLTDLQMPGLAGTELARALRSAAGPPVPLLLMSASRPVAQITETFDGFLCKPVAAGQVAEVLKRARPELSGADKNEVDGKVAQAAVLDERTFAQVAAAMPPERLSELFRLCFAEADRQMRRLELFAAADDDRSFSESAHTLKGSFGMVGARELAGLAAKMELAGLGTQHGPPEREGVKPSLDAVNSTTKAADLANFKAALHRLRVMLRSRGVEV